MGPQQRKWRASGRPEWARSEKGAAEWVRVLARPRLALGLQLQLQLELELPLDWVQLQLQLQLDCAIGVQKRVCVWPRFECWKNADQFKRAHWRPLVNIASSWAAHLSAIAAAAKGRPASLGLALGLGDVQVLPALWPFSSLKDWPLFGRFLGGLAEVNHLELEAAKFEGARRAASKEQRAASCEQRGAQGPQFAAQSSEFAVQSLQFAAEPKLGANIKLLPRKPERQHALQECLAVQQKPVGREAKVAAWKGEQK